jgi:glycolate oxidase subunit GlcD
MQLQEEILSRIDELAGELDFLYTDEHIRIAYGYDATGLRGACGGVAFPDDAGELGQVVSECAERGIPIFVRGAGTGFSGGAIPLRGGLVISTERLNRILRFDAESEEVEVECGVVNQELQDHLEPLGYFYPPDPASLKSSTLGGNISENAGGPRAYRYGVSRRYVRSLTWMTASGRWLRTPAVGPASLLIGAEGTLGILYAARLTVLPLPRIHSTSFLAIKGAAKAVAFAAHLFARGLAPSVMEFIDGKTMRCVGEYKRLDGLEEDSSFLFVEIDGSGSEVEAQQRLLDGICDEGDVPIRTASSEEEREFLWDLRRAVSPSLARRGVTKVNEDVSLPLGALEDAVVFCHEAAAELSLDCYIFGHCGDGNLHVNIMTDKRRTDEMRRVDLFVERLFERVVALGGTLSGEHGIGMTKREYLGYRFNDAELELQRRVKRMFDEKELLNPGKYFG